MTTAAEAYPRLPSLRSAVLRWRHFFEMMGQVVKGIGVDLDTRMSGVVSQA
jgi:hypothetical protein